MPRVLIVANRLPVTVTTDAEGTLAVDASPGGLASGLAAAGGLVHQAVRRAAERGVCVPPNGAISPWRRFGIRLEPEPVVV